jgi:hypothetical protein
MAKYPPINEDFGGIKNEGNGSLLAFEIPTFQSSTLQLSAGRPPAGWDLQFHPLIFWDLKSPRVGL